MDPVSTPPFNTVKTIQFSIENYLAWRAWLVQYTALSLSQKKDPSKNNCQLKKFQNFNETAQNLAIWLMPMT